MTLERRHPWRLRDRRSSKCTRQNWCRAFVLPHRRDSASGSVVWSTKEAQYGTGLTPSVSASGPTVIEVHQEGSGDGVLENQTAALQSSGTVKFVKKAVKYGSGEAPRVSVAGAMILEVHDTNSGVGPIFYQTAAYLKQAAAQSPKTK